MRKIAIIFIMITVCWVTSALAAPMQVAIGVAPLKYIAQKIGGNLILATVLVPAGADAHTYEPKPSQMRAVAGAAMYLSVGLEFEEAWEPRLKAANPKLLFVHTDKDLSKLPMPAGHEDHHKPAAKEHGSKDHHAEESDPHVWVAPSQMKRIAANIAAAFAKADPAHAKVYEENLASLLREVDGVDGQLRATFSAIPAAKRGFLVFHPAWGYLAKDYGLTQRAIEFEGTEPSPKRLGAIISEAKAKGDKVIFVQPQMSRRTADSIAKAIGARLIVADPLAEDWATNLLGVAANFRDALK